MTGHWYQSRQGRKTGSAEAKSFANSNAPQVPRVQDGERCHPRPQGQKSHAAVCIHLCVDTAGEQTITGENTIMEDKPRQQNVFRVHSPLSKERVGYGGKSPLIKMKNSEATWWVCYLRLHGKCRKQHNCEGKPAGCPRLAVRWSSRANLAGMLLKREDVSTQYGHRHRM